MLILLGSVFVQCFVVYCCALFCVLSSVAIILMGKRELVALLYLYSWCLVTAIGLWLFLTVVLWVDMQYFLIMLAFILPKSH